MSDARLEIGERVRFRSLRWEVAEADRDGVVGLFGRDRENQGRLAHVVLGLGEPIERLEVPQLRWTVGEPRWSHLEWRALHDAYRLTLSHGRGNLASADWGRLILEPYQLVPLQRIESLPFPRILIADDTGLGKTAEAGLILFRLLQRRRADRILILCRAQPEPERWRDEMLEKFGIDFTVINDGDDYARIRRDVPAHLNVFGHIPRIAMSMYFAAPTKRGTSIADDLSKVKWDAVVVDEAHHLAESGDGGKRLAELGEIVAQTCEEGALILLTATPHDGRAASFASLLRLIDPYLVVDPDRLDPAIVRPLVVRRLKPRVIKADGSRFLRREVHPLSVPGTTAERALDKGLRSYCRELRQKSKALASAGERNLAMGATFLETFFRRRLASSAHSLRESLRNRLDVLAEKRFPTGAPKPEADRDSSPIDAARFDLPSGKSEEVVVKDLLERADRIPLGREAKVDALVKLVKRILEGTVERVVVFTEFVDTLDMLATVFESEGFVEQLPAQPTETKVGRGLFFRYEGSTPAHHRREIRSRFLSDPNVRVLLATDAASESINLHHGCRHVVHMETVWNPNRYEQRNGRIDRYGQTQRPQVYLLYNEHSIDERVATVGYAKLEKIAEDLGSVSNVLPIGQRVDVTSFIDRLGDERIADVEKAVEARLDEAAAASRGEEEAEGTGEIIRGESFDEADLRGVEEALTASRAFVPEFGHVRQFLEVFLRAEGGDLQPVPGEPDVFSVRLPDVVRRELGIDGVARGTFLRDLAVRDARAGATERVEFLSPGHRVVGACLRRARGWVHRGGFSSRVTYRRVAASSPDGILFTFAMRFLDGRGEAIEERFESVLARLDGSTSTSSAEDLQLFLSSGSGGNVTDGERRALQSDYAAKFDRCREAAEAEAKRRADSRAGELEHAQRLVVEEALIRLGRWKLASEDRLRRRTVAEAGAVPSAVQLSLEFSEDAKARARLAREAERRRRLFREEQERLLKLEERRRVEIRSMGSAKLESLDLIGAVALVRPATTIEDRQP